MSSDTREHEARPEKPPPRMLYTTIFGEAALIFAVAFVATVLLHKSQSINVWRVVVSCLAVGATIGIVVYGVRHQRQAHRVVTDCHVSLWVVAIAYVGGMDVVEMLLPDILLGIFIIPENLQFQYSRNGMILRSTLTFVYAVLLLPFNMSNSVGLLLCGLLVIISMANAIATAVYYTKPRPVPRTWLGLDTPYWVKVTLLIGVIIVAGFAIWFIASLHQF